MTAKVANAVGYQLVWFISVVGAANGMPFAGPAAAFLFAIPVLGFGGNRGADLALIPIALLIGTSLDSIWIALGWLHYSGSWPSPQFAPAWIVGIWVAFVLTLNHSMAFLKDRYVLAGALGAVGGPLAYWSASSGLGAVHFDASKSIVLSGLAIAWAGVFPLLVRIADRRHASKPRVAVP